MKATPETVSCEKAQGAAGSFNHVQRRFIVLVAGSDLRRDQDVGDQHSGVRGSRDAGLANRNRDRIVFWILVLDPCIGPCIGSSLSGTGAPSGALANVTPGN